MKAVQPLAIPRLDVTRRPAVGAVPQRGARPRLSLLQAALWLALPLTAHAEALPTAELLSSGLSAPSEPLAADNLPLGLLLDDGRSLRSRTSAAPNVDAPSASGQAPLLAHKPFAAAIERAASLYNVDAALVHAVINTESGYNAKALSPKGAIGLMQLMPDTARRYGVKDARPVESNILAGTAYLRDLLDMFKQDKSLAVAAYNAGENAVIRHGNQIPPYKETRSYVPKVIALYNKLLPGGSAHSGNSTRIHQRFASRSPHDGGGHQD